MLETKRVQFFWLTVYNCYGLQCTVSVMCVVRYDKSQCRIIADGAAAYTWGVGPALAFTLHKNLKPRLHLIHVARKQVVSTCIHLYRCSPYT